MFSERSSGKVLLAIAPEIAYGLGVEVDVTKVRFGDLVSDASGSCLGDDQLRHGGAGSRELQVIVFECIAVFATVLELTVDEEVDPSLTDVWCLRHSVIEGEDIPGVLSSDQ